MTPPVSLVPLLGLDVGSKSSTTDFGSGVPPHELDVGCGALVLDVPPLGLVVGVGFSAHLITKNTSSLFLIISRNYFS